MDQRKEEIIVPSSQTSQLQAQMAQPPPGGISIDARERRERERLERERQLKMQRGEPVDAAPANNRLPPSSAQEMSDQAPSGPVTTIPKRDGPAAPSAIQPNIKPPSSTAPWIHPSASVVSSVPTKQPSSHLRPKKLENLLRSKGNWCSRMRFQCGIPQIPFDPKLVDADLDIQRFTQYAPTSLEANYTYIFHIAPNMGIPIDLIDPFKYQINSGQPLAREDEELLHDGAVGVDTSKPSKRTSITPGLFARRGGPSLSKAETKTLDKPLRGKPDSQSAKRVESETAIAEIHTHKIEESFRLARQLDEKIERGQFTHPSDPKLTVDGVFPVYPDFDLWGADYSQVFFDTDPSQIQDDHDKEGPQTKLRTSRGALLMEGSESFIHMLPVDEEADDGKPKDGEAVSSRQYQYTREYELYGERESLANAFFLSIHNGEARYCEIPCKFTLHRKSKKRAAEDETSGFSQDIELHQQVPVQWKRINNNDPERAQNRERLKRPKL